MNTNNWHDYCAFFKEDRAVVKLMNEDGNFFKSIIIPTAYYPLNGSYEVFTHKNTVQTKDESVLKIFDSVKYHIGHCYSNAEELALRLREKGYDARTYVGWLFTSATDFPIHHCWVILNKNTVLDLSDDFTAMLAGANGEHFKGKGGKEVRELIADFQIAAVRVPNSVRCYPVGVPTSFLLYIGCECSASGGKVLYNNLVRKYPRHECKRNCDNSDLNATQRIMRDKGLM